MQDWLFQRKQTNNLFILTLKCISKLKNKSEQDRKQLSPKWVGPKWVFSSALVQSVSSQSVPVQKVSVQKVSVQSVSVQSVRAKVSQSKSESGPKWHTAHSTVLWLVKSSVDGQNFVVPSYPRKPVTKINYVPTHTFVASKSNLILTFNDEAKISNNLIKQ